MKHVSCSLLQGGWCSDSTSAMHCGRPPELASNLWTATWPHGHLQTAAQAALMQHRLAVLSSAGPPDPPRRQHRGLLPIGAPQLVADAAPKDDLVRLIHGAHTCLPGSRSAAGSSVVSHPQRGDCQACAHAPCAGLSTTVPSCIPKAWMAILQQRMLQPPEALRQGGQRGHGSCAMKVLSDCMGPCDGPAVEQVAGAGQGRTSPGPVRSPNFG